MKNKPGIYIIYNKITRQFYIGSAVNIRKRLNLHKYCLRKNKSHNQHLQNSFNKHGEINFIFTSIFYLKNIINLKENLIKLEQYYIDILRPHYNKRLFVETNMGFKHTEETKKIISNKHKLNHPKKYTLEERIQVGKRMKGNKYAVGHSPWNKGKKMPQYLVDNLKKINTNRIISSTELEMRRSTNKFSKIVQQFDLNDNLINEFRSTREASRVIKKSSSGIIQVCNNKQKIAYGYKWKYKL